MFLYIVYPRPTVYCVKSNNNVVALKSLRPGKLVPFSSSQLAQCQLALMSCSSVCHQLDSWSVFAYPKQRATVLVGSVLKWRARPQCLHRQLKCLRVSKTESYSLSRICFEMTRHATKPSSKAWLCLADEQHKRHGIWYIINRVSQNRRHCLSRFCFEKTRCQF
jgi:hypothetical protein